MTKATLIALLAGVLVLSAVACGGQPEATATVPPDQPVPAAIATAVPSPRAISEPTAPPTPAGTASSIPAAAPVPTATPTPDLERQAIISFTRQALEIEGKRNELMAYFAGSDRLEWVGVSTIQWSFLSGVLADSYSAGRPAKNLEGMYSLRMNLLLLSPPEPLQAVKDLLVHVYDTEVQQAELETSLAELDIPPSEGRLFRPALPRKVYPEVTKDNLEDWTQEARRYPVGSPMYDSLKGVLGAWGQAQLLRQQVYVHWSEILREHGIGPAKEGFAELTGQ